MRSTRLCVALVVVWMMGTAGGGAAFADGENPLVGTRWQLVEFISMDDAQGVTRPADPSSYTMELREDGKAYLRLNCNLAKGEWGAEPAGEGSSGTFTLKNLAMTRAACPPPSMDTFIALQAEYIRSYLLRDGMLHLSLMADGGIFTWKPLEETAGQTAPDGTERDPGAPFPK